MINVTQIGVDKPSGSPLITKANTYSFDGDLQGTSDIFYYLGENLGSSDWVNPTNTEFLQANLIQNNNSIVPNGASVVIDNSSTTTFINNQTSANIGVELKFLKTSFRLNTILLNGTEGGWKLKVSEDGGNNFTNLSLIQTANLGGGWYTYSVASSTANFDIFHLTHGQEGVSKSLNCIRFYGEYETGDFAPTRSDNTLILNCRDAEGSIFLPDAVANNYPEDFYFESFNLYNNSYQVVSIQDSTTPIIDNTSKPLTKGDKYIFVYNSGKWNVFKVGATPNLGIKGALLSQDGIEPVIVPPGVSGQTLIRDDATVSGLSWINLSINNQIFNPVVTSNFTLNDSFNNRMIPIDTTEGDIIITLGLNLQPGFQIIIYHYGGGVVTINPNGQIYRARGNSILNSNASITLAFDLDTNTWYGIGDLVQV